MNRRLCLLSALLMLGAATAAELKDVPDYKLGLDALDGNLWDLAATRFQAALQTPELENEARQEILLRLAESRIRGGKSQLALDTLGDPALAENAAQPFWRAQAIAGTGRFREALDAFDSLAPDSPHHDEAVLTSALLERAIGDTTAAIESLDTLLKSRNAPVSARLLKAEMLLGEDRAVDALDALPDPARLPAADARRARLLRARCLTSVGKTDEAIGILTTLAEPGDFHTAIVELAKARLAKGEPQAAADGLLPFIQKFPESPVLGEAFDVLLECLSDEPLPNDPILVRLREWTPPAKLPPPPGLIDATDAVLAAIPTPTATTDSRRAPEAMFHLALGIKRLTSPEANASARLLLTRLRLEYPGHPLVARSLIELGRWNLEAGRSEQATACFDALSRLGSKSPPEILAQGLALEASSRFAEGDFEKAAGLFDQSSELLESGRRRAARQNAAIALLSAGNLAAFDQIADSDENADLQTHLALERALYLTSKRDPEALPALLSFIHQHPDHPRIPEARLHAALAALHTVPPDLEEATDQLEAITPDQRSQLPAAGLALAEIQVLGASESWDKAAARAAGFLQNHPDSPEYALILFERGRALFRNKDFTEAVITLKSVAEKFPDAPEAPAALFLAARAAAKGATPQSQRESIALFEQAAAKDSPFRDVARLEMAELHKRLSQFDDAIGILQPWFDSLPDDSPLLPNVGFLLGETILARAQGDATQLEQVLKIHDRLLKAFPEGSVVWQQVLYQKGLTLERFGDRQDEAFDAYMKVVQAASQKPEGDWKAIEDCGNAALRILEERKKWAAAKKLALRIRDLNGPGAAAAGERAKRIGLDHQIW